jgi:hypothetical protein
MPLVKDYFVECHLLDLMVQNVKLLNASNWTAIKLSSLSVTVLNVILFSDTKLNVTILNLSLN